MDLSSSRTHSGLEAYERVARRRSSNPKELQRLLQSGSRAYYEAVRKIGTAYADALLEQMALAL